MFRRTSLESSAAFWAGRESATWQRRQTLVGAVLLALGMLSSVALINAPGTFDVTDPRVGFLAWMDDSVRYGLVDGYRWDPYDYPPGTKVLLGLAGRAGDAIGITRAESLKALLLVFQALTAAVVLALTRNALLAGCVWLCTTTSAIGQGYLDILYAPFLIVSLVGLAQSRPFQAWGFLLVACAIKPQPLVLVPFYVVHLLHIRGVTDLWRVVREPVTWGAASWTAVAVLLFVVTFGRTDSGNWAVVQALQKATAHKEVSGNAMNAGWIGSYVYQVAKYEELGPNRLRDTTWRAAIKAVAAVILAWVLWLQVRLPKRPETALLAALAGYMAYFTFNAGVHENHLFIAMLIALLTVGHQHFRWSGPGRRHLFLAIGVVAFAHLNPLLFFDWRGFDREPTLIGGPTGLDISVPLSVISLVLFAASARALVASGRVSPAGAAPGPASAAPGPSPTC
jgi:hypothetical protein